MTFLLWIGLGFVGVFIGILGYFAGNLCKILEKKKTPTLNNVCSYRQMVWSDLFFLAVNFVGGPLGVLIALILLLTNIVMIIMTLLEQHGRKKIFGDK